MVNQLLRRFDVGKTSLSIRWRQFVGLMWMALALKKRHWLCVVVFVLLQAISILSFPIMSKLTGRCSEENSDLSLVFSLMTSLKANSIQILWSNFDEIGQNSFSRKRNFSKIGLLPSILDGLVCQSNYKWTRSILLSTVHFSTVNLIQHSAVRTDVFVS